MYQQNLSPNQRGLYKIGKSILSLAYMGNDLITITGDQMGWGRGLRMYNPLQRGEGGKSKDDNPYI